MGSRQPVYISTDLASADRLLGVLGRTFQLEPAEHLQPVFSFCDTFDWALFRAGWALEVSGPRYRLLERASGKVLVSAEESAVSPPRFAWDFAHAKLQNKLARKIKLRALIRLLTIQGQGRRFTLRDSGNSLVGRCDLVSLQVERGNRTLPFVAWCSFGTLPATPELAVFLGELRENPDWSSAPASLLEAALSRAGIKAADYSRKVDVALTPDLHAAEAARRIARRLQAIMRANLPGIRQDADIEFLHDFRVSVRKTRSLLRLMQDVLPPQPMAEFNQGFKSVGQATGRLRDLDVYLLKRRDYGAMLPAVLQPGLKEYFAALADRRRHAWREVVTYLDDPEFEGTLQRWDRFLAGTGPEWENPPASADLSVLVLAKQEISKILRRILRQGSRITPASQDRKLHRLRIRCKRLRYTLEFFAPLLPAGPVGRLLRQLKGLQDNLGEFNDLSVQEAHLQEMLITSGEGQPSAQQAAALGALILQLHARKRILRREFTAAFAAFAAKKNRRTCKRLLQ